MTTKRILHLNEDGSVAVTWPNPKARLEGESEGDFLFRVWERLVETSAQITDDGKVFAPHITEDSPFKVVDASEVPLDRSKRAALLSKDDPAAMTLRTLRKSREQSEASQ